MELVETFELMSGETLDIYDTGVSIRKLKGKIVSRTNPTASFTEMVSKGGKAKREREIDELLEGLGADPNDAVERTLAKGATSQSAGWLRALLELIDRHKEGGKSFEFTRGGKGTITFETGELKGTWYRKTDIPQAQAQTFLKRLVERTMSDDPPTSKPRSDEDFSLSK